MHCASPLLGRTFTYQNLLLNMLKHTLLFIAAVAAIAFHTSAKTEYIEVGDIAYNISYSDGAPISAQATRYVGHDQNNYPYTIKIDIPDNISVEGQTCPVTSIAKEAFQYQNATSISLGDNVEWIGEYAFNGSRVDELVLPSNVQSVYEKSLPECKKLIIEDGDKNLSFLKTVTSGNAYDWNLQNVTSLYMGRNINGFVSQGFFSNISELSIGASVTKIYKGLFRDAKKLQLVTLPAGLEEIGESAFSNTEFTILEIPASVTFIGQYAFSNTKINSVRFDGMDSSKGLFVDYGAFYGTSFANVYIDRNLSSGYYDMVGGVLTSSQASLQNVEMGSNVTVLGYNLLEGCSRLVNVVLGRNVRQIDSGCFMNCNNLCSVSLPESLEAIGSSAFAYCTSLTGIVLPANLSDCSPRAFEGCSSLKSVNIPDKIETIKYDSFNGCSSLENVSFGSGIKRIDDRAFSGCCSLRTIVLPEGIEILSSGCFKGCSRLSRVEFPSSFKTFFGWGQFEGCNSLSDVVCYGTIPATTSYGTNDLPFDSETYSSATLMVPDASIDAYKVSKVWAPFFNITGVDEIAVPADDIRIINGRIVSLTGDLYIEVYAPNGTSLYKGNVSASPQFPKGIYVIKSTTVKKYSVL